MTSHKKLRVRSMKRTLLNVTLVATAVATGGSTIQGSGTLPAAPGTQALASQSDSYTQTQPWDGLAYVPVSVPESYSHDSRSHDDALASNVVTGLNIADLLPYPTSSPSVEAAEYVAVRELAAQQRATRSEQRDGEVLPNPLSVAAAKVKATAIDRPSGSATVPTPTRQQNSSTAGRNKSHKPNGSGSVSSIPAEPAKYSTAAVIHRAASLAGIKYRAGGTTPAGFDCSGYTSYVFAGFGIALPHTSGGQYDLATRIKKADAKPGDLVFWHGKHGVYHVAIYAGSGLVWHSPYPGRRVQKVRIWGGHVTYGRIPASAAR